MASIYDKSSLVLIPSGTKTGKIFSQKPVSGDGDFTFTRASAATRVNADGNIEKETSNLLLQSNQFDTTWSRIGSSLTSGQSGYDGSNEAWLLQALTTTGASIRQSVSKSGVQAYSVYAKAGTANYLGFYNIAGLIPRAWFDLSNGSVGTTLNNIDAKIESVGNGWYKCSLIYDQVLSEVRIYAAASDNTFATSVGDNIYIQDAQLEQGLVATPYIPTTTTTAQAGVLETTPRLNYTTGVANPYLLLEPSRTNIILYSEGMFDSEYSEINGIVVAGQQVDLNGTNTAAKLSNFVNSSARLDYTTAIPAVSGKTYTYSGYYKGSGNININVSSSTGVGGAGEKTITLTDEWVRHSITVTFNSSPTGNVKSHLAITRTPNNNAEVYLCFVQIEEGAYATSYIPTYSVSTTRAADTFVDKTLNYGGVFSAVFDIDGLGGKDANNFLIKIGQTNPIYLSVRRADKKIQFYSAVSGDGYFATPASKKIGISCDGTNWIWASDGTSGTLTATGVPNAANIRIVTSGTAGGGLPGAKFNKMLLFDTTLSANELATLTTI